MVLALLLAANRQLLQKLIAGFGIYFVNSLSKS
jgi:hypothetical protein